jgi:PAS domain S-box-containing protein
MSTTKTKAQLELELKQAKKQISKLESALKKAKGETLQPQGNLLWLKSNEQSSQNEYKYRLMVEQLPLIIYINPADDPSHTVYISPQIKNIFGYSAEEWLTDPKLWTRMLDPQDYEHVLAEVKRIEDSGEPLNIEYRMIADDNRKVWVHDEAVLVRDPQGNPLFWQGYMIDITERKQMWEALLESEARYRDLVENSHDLICTHDLEGNLLSVNDAAVNLTGFSRDALINMNLQDRLSPASRAAFKRYLRTIQTRGWAHGEMTVLMANGETRIWEYDNTLRTEGVEKPIVRGMARDITERKKAEEELQKSEERYRSIAEDMPAMICRFTADGTLTFINSFYCQNFNSTYEKLLGSNLFSLIPENEHELIRNKFLSLDHENPYITYEHKMTHANGVEQWQKWTDRALFDSQGRVVEYQSIGEDITEQKQAEEVLKQSEERFQLLFEHSPDAIMLIDPHSTPEPWVILDCNEAAGHINGYAREELIGQSIEILNSVVDNTPDGHANYLELLRRSGTLKYETEHRRRDGSSFSVEVLTSIVSLAGRELVLGIDRDITERKQAEDTLKEQEFWLKESQRVGRIGSYVLDIESGIWTSSAIVDDIFGIDADAEKTIASWNELVHPKQRDEMLHYFKHEVLGMHQSFNKEYLIVRARDGQIRWVWGQGELSMNETGTPTRMFGTIQDITERKQAEMAISEWKNRYETTIRASGQLLYDWRPDTNLVTYAGDTTRILGYSIEEMTGDLAHWVELIHPQDRNPFNREIEQVLAKKKSFNLEYRIRRKDGIYMEVQDEGHFILDASGDIIQMVGFIHDITERKAVEQKLEDSKKFFQYALDALSAHIAILDENGVITAVNRNWREFGRSNGLTLIGDGVGVNYLDLCLASSGEGALEAHAIAHAIQTMLSNDEDQAQKVFEYSCHTPQENRWFVAGLTKFEEHGQPRVVVSHENITQRKLTEENIERRVVELEALYQSGISFSQTLDEKDIGEKVIEILSGSLNWHHAAVRVRRGDTDYVELLASIHTGEVQDGSQRMQSAVSRVGVGLSGWVIEHGKPLRINNLNEDPRYVNTFAGMKSGLYIPMRTYDRTIGCISAESDQLDAFTEKDEHLLTTLATQAAIAIQNADLFKSIQNELARRRQAEEGNLKQLARLTALQEIDRTIISTFDLQLSLTTLLSRALQILSVDAACVLLINTELDTLEYKSGLGFRTSVVQSTNLQMGESYAGIAAQERRMVKIPNMAEEPENLFLTDFLQEGFVSYFGAPLIAKGKVIGVLEVFHRSLVERDDEWLDYFGTLAELAAIAIDNANLYSMSQHELAERKLAEEALLQSYAGLEWRVKERTADLKKANLDLEQALRIKDEFLASMSHELRTPLNAIIGLSESLAEQVAGPLNEKQQRYIHTIGESGHHLLDLINDILDLAKIEAGYMELNINIIQVEALCQSSIRMIKELAQKKSLNVSFEMEGSALTVSGDERKLKQTLVNLLGNAVKFTPAGSNIGLKVTTDAHQKTISFTVWDNGIGIAADQIPLLFKPFVQLDGGLSREYAGTGLGLALVDKMINLHGGTVSVESEKDRGSSFTITLPWESQPLSAPAEKMPQLVETSTRVRNRSVGSILLVEDTEEIIILLNDYLSHKGYTVSIARNGAEGVVLALQEPPDLILMDVMMPIMDGLQATRKMRAEPTLKHIPIIGLTSLAMPGDYDNCIAAGMTNYISKPVELKTLTGMITEYLSEDGKSDK